jgi:hypothetical protein
LLHGPFVGGAALSLFVAAGDARHQFRFAGPPDQGPFHRFHDVGCGEVRQERTPAQALLQLKEHGKRYERHVMVPRDPPPGLILRHAAVALAS